MIMSPVCSCWCWMMPGPKRCEFQSEIKNELLTRRTFLLTKSTFAGYPQVFEAVLAWVRHQREERESCLPELLSKTRLPLCRPQFLADRVQQDELVRCCHKCRCVCALRKKRLCWQVYLSTACWLTACMSVCVHLYYVSIPYIFCFLEAWWLWK